MKLSRRTVLSSLAASTVLGSVAGATADKGEKSVIWLWLGGGISATEFLNPIPGAPVEYRSVTGHVATTGDYDLGGNFQRLASIGHKLTPVRSFAHQDASHGSATGWVMTGHKMVSGEGAPQVEPSYGSIISSFNGSNTKTGVPTYVKVNKIQYDDSVWLGSEHVGFEADGEGIKSLKPNIETDAFQRRMEIVRSVDRSKDSTLDYWSGMREQAYNIVAGTAAQAFNLQREDPRTLDKYRVGQSSLGKSLLLSRRLIQRGSKFITIHHGGWDMHSDIKAGFDNLGPDVDYSIYTLVEELEQLGMLQNTMIIITSEFSRTPKLNGGLAGGSTVPGRDHWPGVVPLMLIGGDYSRGNVIGTTNALAEYPTSTPFGPKDLTYTIFDHFGIDKSVKVIDNSGRPRYFVEEDARLIG